jgi:hypothetical protein
VVSDCWSDNEYFDILNSVKAYLWTYVQPSATIQDMENAAKNLASIDQKELDYLSAVHFLLSNEVKVFVETLPKIFRKFSHSAQKELLINQGYVKGRIDWNRTIKERCTKGHDRTVFVCSPARRIYNLPENQLLKYTLVQIRRLLEETDNLPVEKMKEIISKDLTKSAVKEKWMDRILWLKLNVNLALKNIYLRDVELPHRIDERVIKRTRNARNKDYETIADCYCVHSALIQKTDPDQVRRFIEQRILEPLERDTLFELWVLFQIVDLIGEEKHLSLIKQGAETFAKLKLDQEEVNVYYQKPSAVLKESQYKEIFNCYDLDVNLRRPDIILEFTKSKKIVLFEVKRSSDKSYIVDGAYKILGYLADFNDNFPSNQNPKAVLVVWTINRLEKKNHDLIILDKKSLSDGIKEVIRLITATQVN